jgi:hypothetical protein
MSFALGTTCDVRRGQTASHWAQSGGYPPQRTHVRLPLWKTVDNQRQFFSFPVLAQTTFIHNPQPLLQALDIYLPFTINNTAHTQDVLGQQRSRHEVSL